MRILGSLSVQRADGDVRVDGARRQALLGRLAIAGGRPVPQRALIADLWGEDAGPAARNGLQVLVGQLRRLLGADLVLTTAGGYALGPAVQTDLQRFERAARDGVTRAAAHDDLAAAAGWSLALREWRGAVLDGLDPELLAGERAALEERRLHVVQALGTVQVRLGAVAAALDTVSADARAHPLREELVAVLVDALVAGGRRVDALELVEATRARLRDEYGVGPGPVLGDAQRRALQEPDPGATAPAVRAGIARLPAAIIGREQELQALQGLLREPGVRLVTVVGPAGVGKTRIAEAVVEADAGTAAFVSLLGARRTEDVAVQIAADLGLAVRGEAPIDAVVAGLRADDRLRVLVLDNLEHLPGAAAVVERLLVGVPGLAVLATSRRALRLPVERRFSLHPVGGDGGSASAAGRIFLQAAARADPGFALAPGEADDLTGVLLACEGLPLALELAASWLDVLSLGELHRRLADRLGTLVDPHADAPDRDSSVRASVDWSVDLLPPPVVRTLEAAAVFAGGFTRAALAAVAGLDEAAAAAHLAQLVDRSLVARRAGERFGLLHVVRETVLARASVDRSAALRREHLVAVHRVVAAVPRSRAWPSTARDAALLRAEQANVREAVRFAAEHDLPRLVDLLVTGSTGWMTLGNEAELIGWCADLLARPELTPVQRFDALLAMERAVGLHGGVESARLLEEAHALRDAVDRDRWLALDVRRAYAALYRGDGDEGRARAARLRAALLPGDEPELLLLADQLDVLLDADGPTRGAPARDGLGVQLRLVERARALGLEFQAQGLRANAVELLLQAGRSAAAEEQCLRLLAEVPQEEPYLRVHALLGLALALLEQGRHDRATATFGLVLPLLRGRTFTVDRQLVVLAFATGRLLPLPEEERALLLAGWRAGAVRRGQPVSPLEQRLRRLAGDLPPAALDRLPEEEPALTDALIARIERARRTPMPVPQPV